MSSKALAMIGVRLMSLFILVFIVGSLNSLVGHIWYLFSLPGSIYTDAFTAGLGETTFYVLIPLLTQSALFFLTWFGAPWLAGVIVKPLGNPDVALEFDARLLIALAAIFFGAYLLYIGMRDLLSLAFDRLFHYSFSDWNVLSIAVLHLVIGAVLVFGPGKISHWVMQARSAGTDKP